MVFPARRVPSSGTWRRVVLRKSTDVSEKQVLLAICFIVVSCLTYSWTLNMEATFSCETSHFNSICDVIYQRTELLILVNSVTLCRQVLLS
jgi:hypothetical protein